MSPSCLARGAVACLVALALVVASASCGEPGGDVQRSADVQVEGADRLTPRRGGRLVYGVEADPNGLDPTRNAFDPVGIQLANALYDPVAAFDVDGVPRPYLAASIEPEPGSQYTAWRIVLRPGIRFHSGAPLDAAAARTFIEATTGVYVDPLTGDRRTSITQDAAQYIAGTDVVSDMELRIRMHRPWSTFPALLTGQGGFIVSPSQIADPQGHSRPDGTGPFRLRRWEPGERFELVRNDDYWRSGLPYLDRVDFAVEPDGDERINQLREGHLDALSVGYVSEVDRLQRLASAPAAGGSASIRLHREAGATESMSIMFNTSRPPLDSELVRQALAYATDVGALARSNGWDEDRIVTGPFPPTSPWHVPSGQPGHDPAKAKLLLDEYRRETGVDRVSFELMGANEPQMLMQLAQQWATVGIDARIQMTDFTRTVPIAVVGAYDAIQFRYFSAVDPDSLYHFWTSETRRAPGELSLNFTRYATPEIDEALRRGRSTLDPTDRHEAYGVVQRAFGEAMPYLWLFQTEWVVAHSERVHDARNVSLPDGRPALAFDAGTHRLTETWIAA